MLININKVRFSNNVNKWAYIYIYVYLNKGADTMMHYIFAILCNILAVPQYIKR